MSLSGPRGLVCQVHSNVADSNYDMIWQVCGHNQIENEEYFHWRAKFRESWAPEPHGNTHRWLTSRHESQKTMLWKVLQSRLNSFSLRVCAEKAHAVRIFSAPHSVKCFCGLVLHPYTRFGELVNLLRKASAPLGWLFCISPTPKGQGSV